MQRYTAYRHAGINPWTTVAVRHWDTARWSPWKFQPPFYFDQAACSSALTVPTSAADVVGATLTVPIMSTVNVFKVVGTFEVQVITANTSTFIGMLNVGGSNQTMQALINNQSAAAGTRQTVTQTWKITGLTAGTSVFKLQAQCASAGFRVNTIHSAVTVEQVA
jgi:hypothetical protein